MPHPPKINADEILEQALSLLESGGEEKVTVRAVAARLGVTPNAIYWHYADKATLLVALTARGLRQLQMALALAAPAQMVDLADLLPVTHAYLNFARTRPDLYKLFMSPRADEQAKRQLWSFVVELLTPPLGPVYAAEAGVAVWAYLHGVAELEAMNPFYDGKPRSGADTGLHALLNGLMQGGREQDQALPR